LGKEHELANSSVEPPPTCTNKITGDLFSGCVHTTVIIENMYKMTDIMWYTYSFKGRMVVVLCGVLINGIGWAVSLDYQELGV